MGRSEPSIGGDNWRIKDAKEHSLEEQKRPDFNNAAQIHVRRLLRDLLHLPIAAGDPDCQPN